MSHKLKPLMQGGRPKEKLRQLEAKGRKVYFSRI